MINVVLLMMVPSPFGPRFLGPTAHSYARLLFCGILDRVLHVLHHTFDFAFELVPLALSLEFFVAS